ncbi:MAG: lipocalin family protein [Pseudomonadota bacterium]
MKRMLEIQRWLLAAGLVLLLGACASTGGGKPPLQTVESLDIDRYLGQWYVIANIPYFAERGNVAPRVIYAARENDDKMDDLYYYREAFGEEEEMMKGVAWVKDERTNAYWKTRFYWPFTFDYYVLAITDDYDVVAVGHPSREYAWIMAREQTVGDADYQAMIDEFARQGWDTSLILKIPQFPEQQGQPGFQG